MKKANAELIVIVPAYNEAVIIEDTLEKIKNQLKKSGYLNSDIIVVNDGSSDATSLLASKHCIVLDHLVNMGSGAATRTGILYARRNKYKYAVTIDADGQHSSSDMIKIIKRLLEDKDDLIIGSRLVKSNGMPKTRIIGNKILNYVTRILLGVKVSDSQSGLKGFSKLAIDQIDIRSNGYEFCSEIIWKANKLGLKIFEVPIRAIYTDYSVSKGQSNINALRIIKNIIIQKVKEV